MKVITILCGWWLIFFGLNSQTPKRGNTTQSEFTNQKWWSPPAKDGYHPHRGITNFQNQYQVSFSLLRNIRRNWVEIIFIIFEKNWKSAKLFFLDSWEADKVSEVSFAHPLLGKKSYFNWSSQSKIFFLNYINFITQTDLLKLINCRWSNIKWSDLK